MSAPDNTSVVGLGEIRVSKGADDVLVCLGLGSCVALCYHDPVAKVSGMAHIVLPSSEGRTLTAPGKFADTAVPALVEAMTKAGGLKSRLQVRIAGGAQMTMASEASGIFSIGISNIEATKSALRRAGLRVAAEDTGGSAGRTVRLAARSGEVVVNTSMSSTHSL
ncbi:MAG: chemotaxis protein CheD [Chloroflexi bacterium]|nr:chemotaxis protein CheD [Chloroflexota bacterium]